MTGTEIATRPVGALALEPGQADWTERQRAALNQLGLAEAPAGDMAVFLHQSQRTQLDPFARQIYMIGRWDAELGRKKWTIQTGIDGFRVVAERHTQYGGQDDIEWCGSDGVWRDVWVAKTPPVAARATVIRKDWDKPVRAVALFHEYAGTKKDGQLTRMWREKGALMIAKCAEALALRKAFPQDLAGIYTAEEMDRTEPVSVPSERADRPAEEPARQPAAPTVDWDAELTKAGNDAEALRALWSRASKEEPDNSALLLRIGEAGRAAAAAEAAQPAGPATETDEPIDAELVDEQPTTTLPAGPTPSPAPMELLDKIRGQLDRLRIDVAERYVVLTKIVGRPIRASGDLTVDEGALVADQLQITLAAANPATALEELLKEPRANPAQLTAIAAALGEHGVKERPHRLAVVSLLIGEPIASTSQLTRSEASHVIDTIALYARNGQMPDTIQAALSTLDTDRKAS